MRWIPAPHLRDLPRVSLRVSEEDVAVIERALRDLGTDSDAGSMANEWIYRPVDVANGLLDRVPAEGGWVELSNRELVVLRTVLVWVDCDAAELLSSEAGVASRPLKRVDRAAHDPSYRGSGWEEEREAAVGRAGGACELCGEEGDCLHVHHRVPFRRFNTPEEANVGGNLLAVCPACHRRVESR